MRKLFKYSYDKIYEKLDIDGVVPSTLKYDYNKVEKEQRELIKNAFSEEMLMRSRKKNALIIIIPFFMTIVDAFFAVLVGLTTFRFYKILENVPNCCKFKSFYKVEVLYAFLVVLILVILVVGLSVLIFRLLKKENNAEAVEYFKELR